CRAAKRAPMPKPTPPKCAPKPRPRVTKAKPAANAATPPSCATARAPSATPAAPPRGAAEMGYLMTYSQLEDDERDARRFRALLNIEDQNQPDMLTVIVKLKHAGLIDDYERVPDLELPEDEAFWDPDSRTIRLRESIFCAANNQIS